MDIHARLHQLLMERGWTEYRLSRECDLAQTTIGNIFRRNTMPSLATLETICKGFGISMSQLFAEEEMVELTPELKELFDCWIALAPEQKKAALDAKGNESRFSLIKVCISSTLPAYSHNSCCSPPPAVPPVSYADSCW